MFGPLTLIVPPIVLASSLVTLVVTVSSLLLTGQFNRLASWTKLKDVWFHHFWWWFGPASKPMFANKVNSLLAQAKGTVIDLGPGSGIWLDKLAAVVQLGHITKIYGVEPNATFHHQLVTRAKQHGLYGVYLPFCGYLQDLCTQGVEKGSIDTVITVHVLCSVGPQADNIAKELYDLLKPGGQWLVYEHVASRYKIANLWQRIHDVPCVKLLNGCSLLRDTEQLIRQAGEWDLVELRADTEDGSFQALPHTYGRLVKRS